MATDKRGGGAIPNWANRESNPGIKIDAGPYIGVIKNNADPARLGRLQVWIPDLGGAEEVSSNWYTVSYASPFLGSTLGIPGNTTERSQQQTYGFWAVPPDVNNLVLITFVMGDATRGYWFACIPNTQTHQMVPASARPDNNQITVPAFFGQNRGVPSSDVYLPANEVNLEDKQKDKDANYLNAPRQILDHQANIILNQGLETDPIRGTVTSSSQRESPSQVVGISSPGRTSPDTATDFTREALDALIKQGKDGLTVSQLQQFPVRKGGHSFVMDDGDIYGDNQLLRLRSAGGHQIVLHDTEEIMYISNSQGNVWVEFTKEGSVNIFGASSVNVRAQKDLNLHADKNINIHAGDTIKMYGEKYILSETQQQRITATTSFSINAGKVGVISDSSLLMKAVTGGWKCSGELMFVGSKIYLNTAGKTPADPQKNEKFEFYKQEDVTYDKDKKRWFKKPDSFTSVAPFTPTHEPWTRQTGALKQNSGSIVASTPQTPKKQ